MSILTTENQSHMFDYTRMSIGLRTFLFGFLYPLLKIGFHHYLSGTFAILKTQGKDFEGTSKTLELVAITNVTVEIACNLAQLVRLEICNSSFVKSIDFADSLFQRCADIGEIYYMSNNPVLPPIHI